MLIDASLEGRATAAGAGIIAPWVGSSAPDPDWHRRGNAAGRDYPATIAALAEDGESDTGYAPCGALIVSDDAAVLRRVAQDLRERRSAAPEMGEIALLDAAQARTAFPLLHPALAAVQVSGGARVDGRRLTAALRRAAVRRGAREVEGEARLFRNESGIGVRAGSENLSVDAVLVAAGAWSAGLLAGIDVVLPVSPQRGQIVHLHSPGETETWPSVLPLPVAGHYLVAFEGGGSSPAPRGRPAQASTTD